MIVAIFDGTGCVQRSLTCRTCDVDINLSDGEQWISLSEELPDGINYIEDGKTVSYGEAPSIAHYFDHHERQWVLNLDVAKAKSKSDRQTAFQSEADPLFFKWQAGEADKAEWEAKRQEIRQRYRYPD